MRHQVKAAVSQAMRATVNKPRFAVTGICTFACKFIYDIHLLTF